MIMDIPMERMIHRLLLMVVHVMSASSMRIDSQYSKKWPTHKDMTALDERPGEPVMAYTLICFGFVSCPVPF